MISPFLIGFLIGVVAGCVLYQVGTAIYRYTHPEISLFNDEVS